MHPIYDDDWESCFDINPLTRDCEDWEEFNERDGAERGLADDRMRDDEMVGWFE